MDDKIVNDLRKTPCGRYSSVEEDVHGLFRNDGAGFVKGIGSYPIDKFIVKIPSEERERGTRGRESKEWREGEIKE